MIKVRIHETDHHLRIAINKRNLLLRISVASGAIFGSLVFGAIAVGNLGLWGSEENRSTAGFVVCSLFLLGIIYCFLAVWINCTVLDISKDQISVSEGPLFWPTPQRNSIPTFVVEQFFVQEIRNNPDATFGWLPSYGIWGQLKSGERIELLDLTRAAGLKYGAKRGPEALFLRSQAKLIEERIERFLVIKDEPVDKRVVERFHAPPQVGG